jgi:hypothetical protein
MKKINQKEIIATILNEAVKIKRKKELFEDAKKINAELKQLNEERWAGLGHGFADYKGPSPIMGLVTPSNYEEQKPEDDACKLDQFKGLERDIDDIEKEDGESTENVASAVQQLEDENKELKAQLAQIKSAVEGTINESKK